MHRRAKVVHMSRTRWESLAARLRSSPPTRWPVKLRQAWTMLNERCDLPDPLARGVVIASAAAAHACAQRTDRKAGDLAPSSSAGARSWCICTFGKVRGEGAA
jgi:hypothetical protein